MAVPGDRAAADSLSPVPPGTGWPGDPATSATPAAGSPAAVRALAASAGSLAELTARQSVCRACPRLVEWREQVAVAKRRSFAAERYWGRPIPGWGADQPAVLIVGLAPAAHGGNRTGRIFTGDRSGDVLFASLWRCGLAAKPASVAAGDGQRLLGARMVVVCLGHFAWQAIWPQLGKAGFLLPRPRPAFGHGAEARVASSGGSGEVLLIGCYHPSQQNTFTGRVTDDMLDGVFRRSRQQAGL